MGIFETLTLLAAMTALALVPSTSVALVVARSAAAGFSSGAAVAAGVVLGDLIFVGLALLGMAELAEWLGGLFIFIRYLAGAYLIWFGISLLRAKRAALPSHQLRSSSGLSSSFCSGLIVTLGDVKAILFYASFFPAFVDLTAVTALEVALIASLTVVSVGGVKLGYAMTASNITSRMGGLASSRGATSAAGGVMVAAGTYLLLKH